MNAATIRMICRMLVVSMLMLPLHSARAGMISAERAWTGSAETARTAVLNALSRADVASQLEAMGIDPHGAGNRVAALSDEEARTLAGRLETLPAGADAFTYVFLLVLVAMIYYLFGGK